MDYLDQLFVQIGGIDGNDMSTWSSYPNFNILLNPDEIAAPVVQVCSNNKYIFLMSKIMCRLCTVMANSVERDCVIISSFLSLFFNV